MNEIRAVAVTNHQAVFISPVVVEQIRRPIQRPLHRHNNIFETASYQLTLSIFHCLQRLTTYSVKGSKTQGPIKNLLLGGAKVDWITDS
jgi:hypothetical protein